MMRLKKDGNEAAGEKNTGGVPSGVHRGFFRAENEVAGLFQSPQAVSLRVSFKYENSQRFTSLVTI